MDSQDFLKWMDVVGISKASEIVQKIGVHRNTAQAMLASANKGDTVEVKETFALAMSAVAAGLPAWGHNEEETL